MRLACELCLVPVIIWNAAPVIRPARNPAGHGDGQNLLLLTLICSWLWYDQRQNVKNGEWESVKSTGTGICFILMFEKFNLKTDVLNTARKVIRFPAPWVSEIFPLEGTGEGIFSYISCLLPLLSQNNNDSVWVCSCIGICYVLKKFWAADFLLHCSIRYLSGFCQPLAKILLVVLSWL